MLQVVTFMVFGMKLKNILMGLQRLKMSVLLGILWGRVMIMWLTQMSGLVSEYSSSTPDRTHVYLSEMINSPIHGVKTHQSSQNSTTTSSGRTDKQVSLLRKLAT